MGFLRWDKPESLLALVYLVYRAALYDSFSFLPYHPWDKFFDIDCPTPCSNKLPRSKVPIYCCRR